LLSAAYTVVVSDLGKYFIGSGGSWTLTLPTPANGFFIRVRNDQGIVGTTGTITLTPPSGTIDGLASQLLLAGQDCMIISDGTNWRTFGRQRKVVLGTVDLSGVGPSGSVILLPPGYTFFKVTMTDLVSSVASGGTVAQISVDGGNTWIAANYYMQGNVNNGAATIITSNFGSPLTSFYITSNLYNARTDPGIVDGVLYPGDSNNGFAWKGTYTGWSTSFQVVWTYSAFYNAAAIGRVNALKIFTGSGQALTAGLITVEGVV
jgi:hypothetical protein